MDVVAVDGTKVGEIVVVQRTYFAVCEPITSPVRTVYYFPTSIIGREDGDNVWLNVSRHDALAQAPFRDWRYAHARRRSDRGNRQRTARIGDRNPTEDDGDCRHHGDSTRTHP